jgi:lipid-A-disaccharide synthase
MAMELQKKFSIRVLNGSLNNLELSMSCDVFVLAGEKSGDLHGEKFLHALVTHQPHLKIAGVGGPKMRSLGMECVLPTEEFQVMGFIDVFLALPKLLRQFYFVAQEIMRLQPKVIVTIDYPGFNLRLIKHLRKKGFPGKCVHFICPSVWAWGKKRIPLMAAHFDLLLSILPFETQLFADTPLSTTYIGHPLVQRIKTYSYKPFPFPSDKKVIALFAGSRKKEIERNLPLYLDVCRHLQEKQPDVRIALSVSEERYRPLIQSILTEKGWNAEDLELVPADYSYELMKAAYLALAKSGTVTLELAMHRVPTLVTYGVTFLDKIIAYDILRIRLPFYCIVNIIANKSVFAELIGPNFTLDKLTSHTEALLDQATRTQIQHDCDHVLTQLGTQDTAQEAAKAILKLLA